MRPRRSDSSIRLDSESRWWAPRCAGLPLVSGGLGPEAARDLVGRLDGIQTVLPLLDDEHAERQWMETCAHLSERADVTGLLAGRLVRMLSDASALDAEEASARLSRALGGAIKPGDPNAAVADQASWVEGFLSEGALLLIHDDRVLSLVDTWVRGLAEDDFVGALPLLRRAFGDFVPAERRAVAARARRLEGRAVRPDARDTERESPAEKLGDRDESDVDWARAVDAITTVDLLLAQPPRQPGALP